MKRIAFARMAVVLGATFILQAGCAQGERPAHPNDQASSPALVDTPQVEVKVNKQYDEHGNLIAFDSTYSSVWRHGWSDTTRMDSLFNAFRSPFGSSYPFLSDPFFNNMFFNDSLLYGDFFHDDFFTKRMELNRRHMDQLMHEMDSVKNRYFLEPGRTPH